jgi:hypothetical protein
LKEPERPSTDLTLTLSLETWSLIVYLTNQAARQAFADFVDKRMHTISCISGFGAAAVALQDAYKAQVPDAANVVAKTLIDEEFGPTTKEETQ